MSSAIRTVVRTIAAVGALDTDTTIRPTDGGGTIDLSRDWEIWGPNGGYVASIALRAAGAHSRFDRPASLVGHFLGVADFDCSASVFGKARKFRRVLKRARLAPHDAIAIGDETRDIEAARAAGIACGAVTWGYAAEKALRDRQPDYVFERMEEIVERLTSLPAGQDAAPV